MQNKIKKHNRIDSRIALQETGYVHQIRLPWTGQASYWWNEACADVMEVFGLPGDRFFSHPTADYMDFYFKSDKDAKLCKILLSDRI